MTTDAQTVAILVGAFVTSVGALAAAVVSIIVALKAPGITRIIAANDVAAVKLASTSAAGADRIASAATSAAVTVAQATSLAAETLASASSDAATQAHEDQSITHDKLDKQGDVLDSVHTITNSAKTVLEDLVSKLTNQRDDAYRRLGETPPPQESRG